MYSLKHYLSSSEPRKHPFFTPYYKSFFYVTGPYNLFYSCSPFLIEFP